MTAAELKPLREFLQAELWEYEDGILGWRINTVHNPEINLESAQSILSELNEWVHETEDNHIFFGLYLYQDGTITTRRKLGVDFSKLEDILWLREKLYLTRCHHENRKPRLAIRRWLWRAEFFLWPHKAPQNPAPVAGSSAYPGTVEPCYEQSEGLENTSAPTGQRANVLHFTKRPG